MLRSEQIFGGKFTDWLVGATMIVAMASGSMLSAGAVGLARPGVMPSTRFCAALEQHLATFVRHQGVGSVRAALLANRASVQLIEEWRAGFGSDFIDVNALLQLDRDTTAAPVVDQAGASVGENLMPLAPLLSAGLQLNASQRSLLIFDTDQLRFLPHMPSRGHIVLVTRDAQVLTPDRARRVVLTALRSQISFSVIWLGQSRQQAMVLAMMTQALGGQLVDLSATSSECHEFL